MVKIKEAEDCGNSPKNRLVQDVAVAFETGDLSDDIFDDALEWRRNDAAPVVGREAIVAVLKNARRPLSLSILHAISHGKAGAANGEAAFRNGETRRFCHVIDFTSARAVKVARVTSYVIEG